MNLLTALAGAVAGGDTHEHNFMIGTCIEAGDDETGQPRMVIHTTREQLAGGPNWFAGEVEVKSMNPNFQIPEYRMSIEQHDMVDTAGVYAVESVMRFKRTMQVACPLSDLAEFDDIIAAIEDVRQRSYGQATAAQMNESPETLTKREAVQPLAPLACSAQIADRAGYHFHRCKRPAKYMVGEYGPRCGLHAQGKWFKGLRKPIALNS